MNFTEQTRFHSKYDPVREAERFVEISLKGKKPGIIVVLGPGENYIKQVLDTQYPYARKYYIQPCTVFDNSQNSGVLYWSPGSKTLLKDFFHQLLFDEFAVAGIAVLEWEPVTRAFPDTSKLIRNEMARILATTASDRATTAYWSKKWFINSVRFHRHTKKYLGLKPSDMPVAIIGAGPGLMEYKESLKKLRTNCFILSIASAVPFLLENNIRPDAVLLSDPGFWNVYHTRALLNSDIPVAMPPSARINPQLYDKPILVLDTNLVFEQLVIGTLGCPSFRVKSFGTSVGTAIDLALKLTTGNIFVLGFDLAAFDLSTHCNPYSFSTFSMSQSSRLQPFYSSVYSDVIEQYPEKSGAWRFSRSFSTYAQELYISHDDAKRIKRYSSSPISVYNTQLGEITHQEIGFDYSGSNTIDRSSIFNNHQSSSKKPLENDVYIYLKNVLSKIQKQNASSLSFNEIVFLRAFCAKELNTILALSVRRELTQSCTDNFIEECTELASRIIRHYC